MKCAVTEAANGGPSGASYLPKPGAVSHLFDVQHIFDAQLESYSTPSLNLIGDPLETGYLSQV